MQRVVSELNPIIRGWFEYFKHSIANALEAEDKRIRMRPRSILKKRHGGRGRGNDHFKWPISYFQELGLFSMLAARASLVPSRKG
jgi:RNA-directed DNA polymerase